MLLAHQRSLQLYTSQKVRWQQKVRWRNKIHELKIQQAKKSGGIITSKPFTQPLILIKWQ